MSDKPETISSLLARREYDKAVPLLRVEFQKYPTNVRIHLQLADALSGAGFYEDAIVEYAATSKYYEDGGLTVQAIAVRKKLEKVEALLEKNAAEAVSREPAFKDPMPRSPLFENMSDDEREAVTRGMELETFDPEQVVIREGEPGSSLYVIVSGMVKVFGKNPKGMPVYLADLGEGDFFGEVSVLTGKPRTATITAGERSELLRLDKEKLDAIVVDHPGVKTVLEAFYEKRARHTVDAMVESLKKRE